jgi:mannose/cellobiose epimerase-like protein (N-acyl-D-glucosamine 2-epimerase family)
MKRALTSLLLLLSIATVFPAWAQTTVPQGTRWLEHLNNDLLPFWNTETAFGKPLGAFPSIRCDDGTLYDERRPCPEIGANPPPNERYLVALSRQAYGYGVAFHLTGQRIYLDAMKAGIGFIRQNAMDRANGGMATIQNLSEDTWGPAPGFRTPQELAYGLLGMAFYYYLTRDPDVLRDVMMVKDYIFQNYTLPGGALGWQLSPTAEVMREDKKLVAQLDQMNAYLVLLTPLLLEPAQSEWKVNLIQLSKVMINQFYSPSEKLFFRTANQPEDRVLATASTDFGHNAKALWMIRWTGLLTGHTELVDFAQDNAQALLARAYIADCGCWAGGVLAGGVKDLDKPWWIYAELDQLTGTLALNAPQFAQYLPRAYRYWFSHFVDTEFGEVWTNVDGRTHLPVRKMPKQWQWKNAYHSFEHALVGYIVAQALNDAPVTLYYAFPSDDMAKSAQPYYYSGNAIGMEVEAYGQGQRTQKLTFGNIH